MLPIIDLGPLSLPVPPLVLLLGFWLASFIAEKQEEKTGGDPSILFKIIWTAIVAGLLGARLSFITRNLSAFQGQWISVFSLNPGLMDPAGGILIALTAGYFVSVRNHYAKYSLFDKLVPFFALLAPAIYLSNYASGAGYGTVTNLPWGIEIWGARRHPVQLYYFLSSLVVLYYLIFRTRTTSYPIGTKMLLFVIYTSGYLTLLSAFQDPGGLLISGFRIFQLLYWGIFTASILIYNKQNRGSSCN